MEKDVLLEIFQNINSLFKIMLIFIKLQPILFSVKIGGRMSKVIWP